jgi:GTP-binding protein
LKRDGDVAIPQPVALTGLFVNRGISRTPLEPAIAFAGDIVTLSGVPDSIAVGDTVTGADNPVSAPIETPPLAPPTLSMDFGANTGPLVGREGDIITSSRVRSRLLMETDNNVTLTVTKSETDSEKSIVYARGELQLGILIEQMRREGFELMISPPRIITRTCPETGKKLEPYEEVVVDVDAEYSGTVVNALTGDRKGVLVAMTENSADGKSRLVFEAPSRGLIGFGGEIATATRGSAVYHHCFLEDREYAGNLGIGLVKGKLVSNDTGKATSYALASLVERGTLFIEPGEMVYPGMVIGESNRDGDMEVNPVRAKAVNNMRTVNKDEKVVLPPPKRRNVEELIGYMNEDEIIEVTPKSVRLRKAELDAGARQRAAKAKKKQQNALKQKK